MEFLCYAKEEDSSFLQMKNMEVTLLRKVVCHVVNLLVSLILVLVNMLF